MVQSIEQRKTAYSGAAGELRAASELSLRGYIVHLPVVDEGGDLWTITEDSGASTRIQVKTATAANRTRIAGHVSMQVNFKRASLRPQSGAVFVLHFVFDRLWHTIVIKQAELLQLMYGSESLETPQKTIYFTFSADGSVFAGGRTRSIDLNQYLNAWERYFPVVPATGTVA